MQQYFSCLFHMGVGGPPTAHAEECVKLTTGHSGVQEGAAQPRSVHGVRLLWRTINELAVRACRRQAEKRHNCETLNFDQSWHIGRQPASGAKLGARR
jgi:hypothetical protein